MAAGIFHLFGSTAWLSTLHCGHEFRVRASSFGAFWRRRLRDDLLDRFTIRIGTMTEYLHNRRELVVSRDELGRAHDYQPSRCHQSRSAGQVATSWRVGT